MDNERSLEEYVLSQDGIIFRGTYKYPVPLPWNFGQVSRAKLTCPVTRAVRDAGQFCARPGSSLWFWEQENVNSHKIDGVSCDCSC